MRAGKLRVGEMRAGKLRVGEMRAGKMRAGPEAGASEDQKQDCVFVL